MATIMAVVPDLVSGSEKAAIPIGAAAVDVTVVAIGTRDAAIIRSDGIMAAARAVH